MPGYATVERIPDARADRIDASRAAVLTARHYVPDVSARIGLGRAFGPGDAIGASRHGEFAGGKENMSGAGVRRSQPPNHADPSVTAAPSRELVNARPGHRAIRRAINAALGWTARVATGGGEDDIVVGRMDQQVVNVRHHERPGRRRAARTGRHATRDGATSRRHRRSAKRRSVRRDRRGYRPRKLPHRGPCRIPTGDPAPASGSLCFHGG